MATINYRGHGYPVREITYHAPDETPEQAISSLVSTDQLNDILYADCNSKDNSIAQPAYELDDRIAFFLPENDVVGTDDATLLATLNTTFPDFVFIETSEPGDQHAIKVVIVQQDGVVTAIHGNCDLLRYVIVTIDNEGTDKETMGVSDIYECDTISKTMSDMWTTPGREKIGTVLKEIGF